MSKASFETIESLISKAPMGQFFEHQEIVPSDRDVSADNMSPLRQFHVANIWQNHHPVLTRWSLSRKQNKASYSMPNRSTRQLLLRFSIADAALIKLNYNLFILSFSGTKDTVDNVSFDKSCVCWTHAKNGPRILLRTFFVYPRLPKEDIKLKCCIFMLHVSRH